MLATAYSYAGNDLMDLSLQRLSELDAKGRNRILNVSEVGSLLSECRAQSHEIGSQLRFVTLVQTPVLSGGFYFYRCEDGEPAHALFDQIVRPSTQAKNWVSQEDRRARAGVGCNYSEPRTMRLPEAHPAREEARNEQDDNTGNKRYGCAECEERAEVGHAGQFSVWRYGP